MKVFSERYGFSSPRDSFQVMNMDTALKNKLWKKLKSILEYDFVSSRKELNIFLYDDFFKDRIDVTEEKWYILKKDLEEKYFELTWYEIYNLIEFLLKNPNFDNSYYKKVSWINANNSNVEKINQILEEEMSVYRIVDNYIVPIIDEVEIQEIEEALEIEYNGAKRHLSNALEFLSDRENPDYPNSIKESISAVEAVAKEITGKETDLASCLKVMDLDLNKQFKTAMTNMYGWTCKEDGIRHGHTGEELKTSFEEAKYMLVTCSAFVNYMIAKKG